MAESRQQIFIDLIHRSFGEGIYQKQSRLFTGLNKVNQKLSRTFSEIEGNLKKVSTVTAGYNKDGKLAVSTNENLIDVSKQLGEKQFMIEWAKKLGINMSRVKQIMGATGITINNAGNAVDLAGREVKNIDKVMKHGELTTRKFNMSMLSVMFAGMALQRSMSGLLRPAAESEGVFDSFSDILITTFGPIMEAIAPIFEKFADVMDRTPNIVKLVIGAFVVFGLVAGVILALVGQLGLAIAGLKIMFGKLALTATTASGSMMTFGVMSTTSGTAAQIAFAPFLPIMYAIVAVIALAVLLFYNWEEVVESLRNTFKKFGVTIKLVITSIALFFSWLGDKISNFGETVGNTFTAIKDFILETWESITTWLSETWENIKEFFKNIWFGMINWFKEKWNGLKDWFSDILSNIVDGFKEKWNGLKDWFSETLGNIISFFKNLWNYLKSWFLNNLESIKSSFKQRWDSIKIWFFELLRSISDFFKNIWNSLKDWLSDKLTRIKEFFSNIWNGIKENTINVWTAIKDTIKGAINGIIGLINKLINAWNSLSFRVPRIKIPFLGTFGGGTYGVPQIPSIPTLAEGGIVTRPTMAMIGERGPEAVVPLGKGYGNTIINFSPTYNINVSDKYEFERMIKFNNTKLVEDLRRTINI